MKDSVQVGKWGICTVSFKCFKMNFTVRNIVNAKGTSYLCIVKNYTQFMKNNSSQSDTHNFFGRQGWYFLHPNVKNLLYKSLAEN